MPARIVTEQRQDEGGAPYQLIRLPNFLGAKVGTLTPNPRHLAAAEAAMRQVAVAHAASLPAQLAALDSAWQSARDDLSAVSLERCFELAFDLSGCGTTFGFPLVTDLCRSLCRFLQLDGEALAAARAVIEAHHAALRRVVTEQLSGDGGPVGRALLAELDRAIVKFRGTP
jgi:hypothetical protein